MMKSSVMIFTLVLISVCYSGQDHEREEFEERKKNALKECLVENNVDEKTKEKLLNGSLCFLDPEYSEYEVCLAIKMGVINEDGDIQLKNVKHNLSILSYDKDTIDEILNECITQGKTPEETVTLIHNCARKFMPPRN